VYKNFFSITEDTRNFGIAIDILFYYTYVYIHKQKKRKEKEMILIFYTLVLGVPFVIFWITIVQGILQNLL